MTLSPEYYGGDLESIFVPDRPLVDLRAPVEFEKGAFPNAVNLPILDNEQRHQVGLCYKAEGQAAAISLGYRLIAGKDKERKIEAWLKVLDERPDALFYCLRGGLRSRIAQHWLKEVGRPVPIIEGGYKRLRRLLLAAMEEEAQKNDFLVISGSTGSAKTDVLNRLIEGGYRGIDLEGIANHRGSAFGRNPTPQPPQVGFENGVAIQFMKEAKKADSPILLEDESAMIGNCRIPAALFDKKLAAPIFVLRVPKEARADFILKDYVEARWPLFKEEEDSFEQFFEFFKSPFDRIQKRFGGALHKECLVDLRAAIDAQKQTGSFQHFKVFINKLLVHYYDPLYEKGLAKKGEHIVGEGDEAALKAFLRKGAVAP